jgi:hypothetical protein
MKSLVNCLVGLAFVGLIQGCGMQADRVTGPEAPAMAPVALGYSETSGQIGSAGGSLATGGVTLSVPARALTQTLTVTLEVTETEGDYFITVEPQGQVLLKHATLIVPCASGNCGILWWNPATQDWENLSVSTSPGYVQGMTIEFSQYDTEEYN